MPLWGGAFSQETASAVRQLNDSLPFDWRLYHVDIIGSKGWATAIFEAGLLTAEEHRAIITGLETVRGEFASGSFVPAPGDEDIHTAVERRLTAMIGPVAGKLHTGRSRNDQIATDVRLWIMGAVPELAKRIAELQTALLEQAEAHLATVMPGFTHLQPAQPITAAHWLLSFAEMLERDRVRMGQVVRATAVCPLGAGALAGTPYAIDRVKLAEALGFDRPTPNSLDAVADRDFIAGFLYASSMLTAHISRLAEDMIMFSNPRFGFITLDERFSTGSSLMPQKRNPDPLELARGKTGRIMGHLSGFLTTLKGLPSGYNKDIQEDKEPLFDTFDNLMLLLSALSGLIATLTIHPEAMRSALDESMLATDLADYLVHKGVPFREAHGLVGQVVRAAEAAGTTLSGLALDTYQAISPVFEQDVYTVFDFDAAVQRRAVIGGPAPSATAAEIAALRASLENA